jgi:hypothetical protein
MFKFIQKTEDGKIKREFPHDDATWGELIEEFQKFLNSCGYVFGDEFDMRYILEAEHDFVLQKMGLNVKQLKEDEHEWVE